MADELTNGLTLDQKLALFDNVVKFRIVNGIFLERRSYKTDSWAITDDGLSFYAASVNKWLESPLPSARTDDFKSKTHYSLSKAVEIVESDCFMAEYYALPDLLAKENFE